MNTFWGRWLHRADELMKRENQEHYRNRMFHGFDTDQTMLRIGAMNLMLHSVDNPDIEYKDSLSTDNTDSDRYTLCLANPPFAGSKQSFFVLVDEIRANDYDLSINKYKEVERERVEYEPVNDILARLEVSEEHHRLRLRER